MSLHLGKMNISLAEHMRPKMLAEYVGQEYLVGTDGAFSKMIKQGIFPL